MKNTCECGKELEKGAKICAECAAKKIIRNIAGID